MFIEMESLGSLMAVCQPRSLTLADCIVAIDHPSGSDDADVVWLFVTGACGYNLERLVLSDLVFFKRSKEVHLDFTRAESVRDLDARTSTGYRYQQTIACDGQSQVLCRSYPTVWAAITRRFRRQCHGNWNSGGIYGRPRTLR